MRICQFSSATLDSHYFENLCRGLTEKGMCVSLASLQEKQHPVWLPELAGARYFFLNAGSWLSYPQAVVRFARLLRRERIDILQTHLFHAGLIGVFAAKLARVPCIVTRHHTDETCLVGTKLHVALDRLMARMADGVVVLSQAVKKHMISRERLVEDKIEVIYQGFDFNKLSASEADRQRVRSEFGFGSDFVIGYVARFFKTKAHSHLIAACSELIKEIPNMRLLLLGGGDRSSITEMIRSQRLEDRVVFAGYRTDVPACMRAMDVVVHPSLTEAFCQAHVEAMASGSPLIATNVAAAPEVITPGETGILIPPADPGAIVTAVLQLYRNPDLRRRMALAGQDSVRRRFTVERMVEQQANCYQRLLRRSPGGEKRHVGS